MKADLYTKIVLTVIAVCLSYIVVRDLSLIDPAHAQGNRTMPVDIVAIAGNRLITTSNIEALEPALPVRVRR